MRHHHALVMLAGGALASGCAGLSRAPVALSPVVPDAPSDYQALAVSAAAPMDNWLGQFNDAQLEAAVTEALSANPGLRAQLALVEAARATARATKGRTGPSVEASASAALSTLGTERFDDPSTSLGLGVSASWEADLWGRLRASVNASEADLAASEADLASAELSIAARTALAWYDFVASVEQDRIARLTLEVRQNTLRLTERRFGAGRASALDVRTARSALAQAEASVAASALDMSNNARALERLLGRYPAGAVLADARLPELGPLPMGGDPMLLLSRRPDLAAAEARLRAAGLRAEAARLALRPSLRLTGSLDLSGGDLGELFDFDSLLSRVAGGLAQPLFNGGALDAEAEAALARARAVLADYTDAVLAAWKEVEDALAADTSLALQEAALSRALEEARLAETLAERQYVAGLTTIFNLIDAQNRRLSAESAVVSARAARIANRIRYHLALGGGVPLALPATAPIAGRSLEP